MFKLLKENKRWKAKVDGNNMVNGLYGAPFRVQFAFIQVFMVLICVQSYAQEYSFETPGSRNVLISLTASLLQGTV